MAAIDPKSFEVKFVGRNAAMVDGSVTFLSGGISRNSWSQLLVDNDGARPLSLDGLEYGITAPSKLKIGNCIRLAVWIAVVLFPLPWVWLKKSGRGARWPAALTLPQGLSDACKGGDFLYNRGAFDIPIRSQGVFARTGSSDSLCAFFWKGPIMKMTTLLLGAVLALGNEHIAASTTRRSGS